MLPDKEYTLDFRNPRVLAATCRAVGMATACLSADKPRPLGKKFIDKHFTHSGRNLGKQLRCQILIPVSHHYNMLTGQCKTYTLNPRGVQELCESAGIQHKTTYENVSNWATDSYGEQLETKKFEYVDQSNRLWSPIQNIRSDHRKRVLAEHGLKYQYDIVCAAPTLLYQYSRNIQWMFDQNDKYVYGPNTEVLEVLEDYIENRSALRKDLAQRIELDISNVKKIVNALFAGALLSEHSSSSILALCGNDIARVRFLKQDWFIQSLREDIATLWDYIKAAQPDIYYEKDGRTRKKSFDSKRKWHIYFEQERLVMDNVRHYLTSNNIQYFNEHDGWSSNKKVDIQELRKYVSNQTGYDINFELTEITSFDT